MTLSPQPQHVGACWGRNSHYNKYSTDDDTLYTTPKNRIGDNRKCFIHNHICKKECNQEQVAILADGLDLVGICTLDTVEFYINCEYPQVPIDIRCPTDT